MKKFFLLMLSAVLFMACSKDDDEPEVPQINFTEYASDVNMNYASMIKKYGEPTATYGTMYLYENLADKKTSQLIFVINPSSNTIYNVMQVFAENAYNINDLQKYFAAKYTSYGYDEEEQSYLYGNAKTKADATLLIQLDEEGVVYNNPQNTPAEIEIPGLDDLTPELAVSTFMGMTEEQLKADYAQYLYEAGNGVFMLMAENDMLMAVGLLVEDGKVVSVVLLFNEDLSDGDIFAYYEKLGFTVTDCGIDEDSDSGAHVYLFMNPETGEMFTYSDLVATFVDMSAMGDDEDGED